MQSIIYRFITKHHQNFTYCTKKNIHHLQKPTKQKRKTQQQKKPKPPEEQEQCVNNYMRDTISNIYKLLKYSTWEEASSKLSTLNIKWDSFTVNQVLKTHPPLQKSWLFFNWASTRIKHDHFTYTTMLNIFGEAGRIDSIRYLFDQMTEKGLRVDAVTYTSMMHWVAESGDFDGVVRIWKEMKERGLGLTVVSYTAYMKVLFDFGKVHEGVEVYKEMIERRVSPSCHTYTVLMEFLVGDGKYVETLDIFSKMQETGVLPDKAACNILVEKCCEVGETWAMTQILQYMKENRLVLRYPVFLGALRALKAAGKSDALLREVNRHFSAVSIDDENAFDSTENADNDSIDRGIVMVLLKRKNLEAVDRVLHGLLEKNIHLDSGTMSIIIEVNCDSCRPEGALLAFDCSMKWNISLEKTAYLALIGMLIRSNTYSRVVEIVKELIAGGHSLGTYHGAMLIYRLGLARRPTFASKIFNLLPHDQRCTAACTALINAYFSVGNIEKALKTYEIMKRKGIRSCLGTYNVLIVGLEKSGRDSEAETYRKGKKSLVAEAHYRSSVGIEEKICDLMFAGD